MTFLLDWQSRLGLVRILKPPRRRRKKRRRRRETSERRKEARSP